MMDTNVGELKEKSKDKKISADRVVWVSFLVDLSDVVLNVFVAWISGSVTMISQALQGVADMMSSGFLLIGVKRAKIPADRKHPYGHGREVYFWTFMSGLAMFVITATLSFYWGLLRFIYPEPIFNLGWSFFALGLATFTNAYAFSLSYRRIMAGKSPRFIVERWKKTTFVETKTAMAQDLMGTAASVVGLIALVLYYVTDDLRYDGIGAMATSLVVGIFAYLILRNTKNLLVGQSADPDTMQKIRKIAAEQPLVESVVDLKTLRIGPERLLVDLEVHVQNGLKTDEIEILIDNIEREIKSRFPNAKHIQVELENPVDSG